MSSKNQSAAKVETPKREATTAAPVAATGASEASTVSTETPEDSSASDAANARKAEIAISPVTKAEASGETPRTDTKVPSFIVNADARKALFDKADADLLAGAKDLKEVEKSDMRIFRIHPDNPELKDQLVGSDLSRSGIRSAVIDFLRTREGNQATGAVICAYMSQAVGISYKGKFNIGYLAARGRDVRRGMVARKQLEIVAATAVAAPEPAVETPAEAE